VHWGDLRWRAMAKGRTPGVHLPQHFLYFLPLPHGQGWFLPILGVGLLIGRRAAVARLVLSVGWAAATERSSLKHAHHSISFTVSCTKRRWGSSASLSASLRGKGDGALFRRCATITPSPHAPPGTGGGGRRTASHHPKRQQPPGRFPGRSRPPHLPRTSRRAEPPMRPRVARVLFLQKPTAVSGPRDAFFLVTG
jgi:hypothetical protein